MLTPLPIYSSVSKSDIDKKEVSDHTSDSKQATINTCCQGFLLASIIRDIHKQIQRQPSQLAYYGARRGGVSHDEVFDSLRMALTEYGDFKFDK